MKKSKNTTDIAIVGMACKFPGADDYEAFWREMIDKKSGIGPIPSDRWQWKDCYGDEEVRKSLKYGGFISDIDCFDADFFGINPREAEKMDPQHRLLLETVWKTIEDAGYKAADFDGKNTGVFIGVSTRDYNFLELYEGVDIDAYSSLGMADTILTNRISFLLNLRGPSEPVDTACSSALVAIHRAVQGIRNGECDSAIAGGVHILCHPFHTISFSKAGMLSPHGRCKTFDKNADGYIRGEGIGTILLKPLSQAIRDKDHIYGVIKGSFINHGGKARTITSPNVYAQAKVISAAFEKAQVTADRISYIEAHGTGTPLGDPVEIIGLKKALKMLENDQPEKKGYCGIGTVKTNIGHLESAAGIAGIIKVLLALKYRQLPALQNFEEINPKIDLQDSPFFLVTEPRPWKRLKNKKGMEIPRIAGISSFGFGGVNAHIVIEEFEDETRASRQSAAGKQTIVLSAKTEDRLRDYAGRVSRFISDHQEELRLPDIAFTLNEGRDLKQEKLVMNVASTRELIEKLDNFVRGKHVSDPDTSAQNEYQDARRIALPTYPFEKKRHWFRKKTVSQDSVPGPVSAPSPASGQGSDVVLEIIEEMSVERTIQLREHIVYGFPIFPTDSLLELIYKAFKGHFNSGCLRIDNFSIKSGLIAIRDRRTTSRLVLTRDGQDYQCVIASKIEGLEESFRENVRCQVQTHAEACGRDSDFMELLGDYDLLLEPRDIYLEDSFPKPAGHLFDEETIYVGPFFRSIEKLYIKGQRAVSRLILNPAALAHGSEFHLHPSILDSLLISAAAFGAKIRNLKTDEVLIPISIKRVLVFKEVTDTRYWVDIRIIKSDDPFVSFDINLIDERHEIVLQLQNLSDLKVRKENIQEGFRFLGLATENAPAAPKKIILRKTSDAQPLPPSNAANELKRLLAETLIIDLGKINDDAGFADLGLDSILGLEYLQKINKRFDINLQGTILYEHSSLRRLSDHLARLIPTPDVPSRSVGEGPGKRITLRKLVGGNAEEASEKTPERAFEGTSEKRSLKPLEDRAENTGGTPRHSIPELKSMLAETLILDPKKIADDTGFADLGLDSILGLEYLQKVNKRFGINLQGTILYEHSSLQKLGTHLEGLLPGPTVSTSHASPRPADSDSADRGQKGNDREQDIAIIGIGLRFPGAENTAQLWDLLRNNESKITDVPASRWDSEKLLREGAIYCQRGGFIGGAEQFDAALFGVSPREAELTDPQLRKLLEVVWETLEDGGAIAKVRGSNTGVYIGNCFNDYREALFESGNKDYQYIGVCNSNSTLSNRVAYVYDLKGPSMTIDTACSSSLVAIDLAVEALRNRTCDLAIAGGVNINVTPTKYLCFCAMGAFSRKGVINPFDEEADGYIPGEGVATLLLKPLAKAESDKDRIYGVIKATSVNSGGKSSGPAVPNPDQEREVMITAWERAGVKELDYLEAHGTGTKIGDPLEINAIKEAVRRAGITGAMSLGTIKANIGHTEAVAGVAGIIKVLLQMQNDFIAGQPSLKTINKMIDLAGTGISIEKTGRVWPKEPNRPRIAGVNSFGMGGTYAHVVIGEYVGSPRKLRSENREKQAFPLSARNSERLKEGAGHLARFIETHKETVLLQDIAHTLQTGRSAMEERAVILAASHDELIEKLERFVQGERATGIHEGNLKQPSAPPTPATFQEWLELGNLERLSDSWVHGHEFDWERLSPNRDAKKISLPTYAFARKRYWIPVGSVAPRDLTTAALHPLLDANASTLSEQKYKKQLHRAAFFVQDHVVRGRYILPGVASLEMARAAGERATKGKIRRIESVVWQRPVEVGENGREVEIILFPQSSRIGFELVSDENGARVSCCRGLLGSGEPHEEKRRLSEIQARCSRKLDREEIYRFFRSHGLEYGNAFQVLEDIVANDRECLGRVSLPARSGALEKGFVLHPSLMDGALQVCMGLMTGLNGIYLPAAVKELTIHHSLAGACFSHVQLREQTDSSMTFDIEILDEGGRVLVGIRGFEARAVMAMGSRHAAERMYFEYRWTPRTRESDATTGKTLLINMSRDVQEHLQQVSGHIMDLLDKGGKYEEYFSRNSPQCIVYHVDTDDSPFFDVLSLCQCLIKKKIPGVRILFETTPDSLHGQALCGFVKTLAQEIPGYRGKVLQLDAHASREARNETLWAELQSDGQMVRYLDGARLEKEPVEFHVQDRTPTECSFKEVSIKEGSVVLITGGVGGLGRLLSRHLLNKYKCRLVLTGRTPATGLDEGANDLLASGNAIYVPGDISKEEDARRIVSTAKAHYGHINGIIHAAGVVRDSLIAVKTAIEATQVIEPKIQGFRHLDELTRNEPLDFFVLFSSIAGVMGNIGQSDYAYANAYLDGYATSRNTLVQAGQRSGKTLSINWPLWDDGGMQIDAETRKYMHSSLGLEALTSAEGLEIFDEALTFAPDQVMVLKGFRGKIERMLKPATPMAGARDSGTVDLAGMKAKVEADARRLVAEILKVGEADIDVGEDMSAYGFDSITFTELTNKVNETFDLNLSPALMFEHSTIGSLADHLLSEETAAVVARYGKAGPGEPVQEPLESHEHPEPMSIRRERFAGALDSRRTCLQDEPIAIIGISGRMPGAGDLDQFWTNLEGMKDCIQEIPAARWDHRKYQASRWGGFLDDIDSFDRGFFNISPHEAELMDPQQRIFLEEVWKTIADAGYKAKDLSGTRTGLYVGVSGMDYMHVLDDNQVEIEAHTATGAAHSVLANRISYLLNITGPSEAIDTACSSSLIAVKRAMESIRSGECDLAIAGGVNVLLHPKLYIAFSKAGMLSEDGRCKTFDKRANGYVRGEGVGAILLKPLSKAERDGDQIYGIIRGASENHGGHVSGLTVPNPNAQADLIVRALTDARVSPAAVSYIEAHGTGTSLGDPIEVNGLKKAFARLAEQEGISLAEGYCGISSVKTSIGHLESASGIAGILKVLLAMKRKKLPGTVHFQEMNPYIELKGTPFFIVDQSRDWLPQQNEPRIAGVSSFGFGGSNAHIILEEYDETARNSRNDRKEEHLIIMSAKDGERLREYAGKVASSLKQRKDSLLLQDIAFTLRVGREAMEERLAFIARTTDEVVNTLEQFVSGEHHPDLIRANTRQKGEILKLFNDDSVMQEAVHKWLLQGQLKKLMELWANGMEINWEKLPRDPETRRIPLPAHPFARQKYWPTRSGERRRHTPQATIHPLLDTNESILGEQRFRKTLSRDEFFVRDHLIRGKSLLPGVASLEMARIAGVKSTRQQINKITAVTWQHPIIVTDARDIEIRLQSEGNRLGFDIQGGTPGTRTVFSHGKLEHAALVQEIRDIKAIKTRCTGRMGKAEIYELYKNNGLEYGSTFQVVEEIIANQRECLGHIQLPAELDAGFDEFGLHPSILDGALQTCLGLMSPSKGMFLPSGIRELCLFEKLEKRCFSHIQLQAESDHSRTYDIAILNDAGKVLVEIKGLETRLLLGMEPVQESRLAFYGRHWVEREGEAEDLRGGLLLVSADNQVWGLRPGNRDDCNLATLDAVEEALRVHQPGCVAYFPGTGDAEFGNVLRLAKTMVGKSPQVPRLLFVTTVANLTGRALAGFARTLEQEHPHLRCKTLVLEQEGALDLLFHETRRTGREVLYKAGKRFEQVISPIDVTASAQLKVKRGGVYVITGGAGGLGRIFARHFLVQHGAKLLLTGRTKEQDLHEPLASLKALGEVLYVEGDVSRKADVEKIISTAKRRFGKIDGIIHSAGTIKDSLILNKTADEAQRVLAPKLQGTRHLDELTRDEKLDFFALFSSVAGVLGNIGQSDYAFANAFMDEYALYRHELSMTGQRHGKSLSINWPLWEMGGMQVDKETRKYLKATLGVEPMETLEGLTAFEMVLSLPLPNILVIKGIEGKIKRAFHPPQRNITAQGLDKTGTDMVPPALEMEIKRIIAEILKVKAEELDIHEDIGNYGVDSILGMQIITTINDTFEVNMVPSVLLECRTLGSIIEVLLKEFPAELSSFFHKKQAPGDALPEETHREVVIQTAHAQTRNELPATAPGAHQIPKGAEPSQPLDFREVSEIPEPPSRWGNFLYSIFSTTSKLAWESNVKGLENLPDCPAIYCSNHESHLDSFFVLMSLPPEFRNRFVVMSKKEHFDSWVMKHAGLKMITAIPVDREGDVLKSLEIGKSIIENKRNLFLHPEGTRTKDGKMNPFKRGAAHIAIAKNAPIVPIRIIGAFEIYPQHISFPRLFDFEKRKRFDLKVIFGKPLYPNMANPRIEEEINLTEQLFATIQSLA